MYRHAYLSAGSVVLVKHFILCHLLKFSMYMHVQVYIGSNVMVITYDIGRVRMQLAIMVPVIIACTGEHSD